MQTVNVIAETPEAGSFDSLQVEKQNDNSHRDSLSTVENYIIDEDKPLERYILERISCKGILKQFWSIQCLIIVIFTFGILITGVIIWLVGFLYTQKGMLLIAYNC